MQLTASEAMKKFGQGPAFRFWFSLSLAMEGKLQEAIREFDNTLVSGRRCQYTSTSHEDHCGFDLSGDEFVVYGRTKPDIGKVKMIKRYLRQ